MGVSAVRAPDAANGKKEAESFGDNVPPVVTVETEAAGVAAGADQLMNRE